MKIIKPSAEYMEHDGDVYKFIEKIGRVCYKSEDKITEDSAIKFVQGLMFRQHYAMLEHETIYLKVSYNFLKDFVEDLAFDDTDYLKYFNISGYSVNQDNVISGSFRSFLDLFSSKARGFSVNHLKFVLGVYYPSIFGSCYAGNKYREGDCLVLSRQDFIDTFKDYPKVLSKHLTHTVKFICDRGVSHEFVRHRPCSFAQESTRYCNYSNSKFGNEITVIKPLFFSRLEDTPDSVKYDNSTYASWLLSCERAESKYFELLEKGATPQEARSVLPNSLKTELVITATEKEWQHIVDLRLKGTTGAPHPQMKEVMSLAIKDLVEKSDGRIVQ